MIFLCAINLLFKKQAGKEEKEKYPSTCVVIKTVKITAQLNYIFDNASVSLVGKHIAFISFTPVLNLSKLVYLSG